MISSLLEVRHSWDQEKSLMKTKAVSDTAAGGVPVLIQDLPYFRRYYIIRYHIIKNGSESLFTWSELGNERSIEEASIPSGGIGEARFQDKI